MIHNNILALYSPARINQKKINASKYADEVGSCRADSSFECRRLSCRTQ
jgi:hypothetical protein